ncbi:hypothetical protein MA20_45745 [Bradyrhizobium japonicum]|uniref:Uncharacterized protein n=1 Tax=Bradyrhizobium japonicum TaxID=375 RepID=A0A0A3XFT4_BRAJP|nr:hypothetical protein MA20_45745 [Bradyrhizobium japonicum]
MLGLPGGEHAERPQLGDDCLGRGIRDRDLLILWAASLDHVACPLRVLGCLMPDLLKAAALAFRCPDAHRGSQVSSSRRIPTMTFLSKMTVGNQDIVMAT